MMDKGGREKKLSQIVRYDLSMGNTTGGRQAKELKPVWYLLDVTSKAAAVQAPQV